MALTFLIAAAYIVYVGYQRLQWSLLDTSKAFKIPLILTLLGLVEFAQFKGAITGIDVAFLAAGLVVSVAGGAIRGSMMKLEVRAEGIFQRLDVVGLVIWLSMLALRIGVDVAAGFSGAKMLEGSAGILFFLGINLLVSSLVVAHRAGIINFAKDQGIAKAQPVTMAPVLTGSTQS